MDESERPSDYYTLQDYERELEERENKEISTKFSTKINIPVQVPDFQVTV